MLSRGRSEDQGVLHITGRDIQEQELAIEFNQDTCKWTVLGDAKLFQHSEQRQAIIDLLNDDVVRTPKQIAEALDEKVENIKSLLGKMTKNGDIDKVGRGEYTSSSVTRSRRSLFGRNSQKANVDEALRK